MSSGRHSAAKSALFCEILVVQFLVSTVSRDRRQALIQAVQQGLVTLVDGDGKASTEILGILDRRTSWQTGPMRPRNHQAG